MHNGFAERIRNIEARINRLKTLGMRGSSTFATTSHTVTIPMLIVSDGYWGTQSKYSARITAAIDDESALVCAYIKSPQNLSNRNYVLDRRTNANFEHEFVFKVVEGSEEDLAIIEGGGTIPPFDVVIEVVATSEFTLSYTLSQDI